MIRSFATRVACALCALALVFTGRSPVAAAVQPPAEPIVPDPRVAPELLAVAVTSPAYDAAAARHRAVVERLTDAEQRFAAADAELQQLQPLVPELAAARDAAVARHAQTRAALEVVRAELQELLVIRYISGDTGEPAGAPLDLDVLDESRRRKVILEAANEEKLDELARRADEERAAGEAALAAATELADAERRLDELTAARAAADRDRQAASAELPAAQQAAADARLTADVRGLDMRFVVLNAYVRAAHRINELDPSCGMRWSVLAGIGRTESRHGTHGGAVVGADGVVDRPIIGVALDGTNGNAHIGDTDGGELDGDVVFDRAVGPMQFIPGTWRLLGLDATLDGRPDPQNIYDAALSAANLLCRSGPLDSDDRLRAAFLRYNNSAAYAQQVLDRVHAYDQFVFPPVA